MPHISDSKNKDQICLAILIQNCSHSKNSDRVKAVADKTYVEIMNSDDALQMLSNILREKLMQKLLAKESDLMKSLKGNESDALGEKILLAPDQFYAAALMTKNKVFFGNGDFRKFI